METIVPDAHRSPSGSCVIPGQHLFLDGYEVEQVFAEDFSNMKCMLRHVNQKLFRGSGYFKIIPVFNNSKPRNNGLSGVILARGGHFTCHTFSRREIFFADIYTRKNFSIPAMSKIICEPLHPVDYDICTKNEGEGFGRHEVLLVQPQDLETSHKIIDNILESINMHPLCGRMVRTYAGDIDIIQPITESHIAIHVAAGKHTVLDVFSCKPFSSDVVPNILAKYHIHTIHTKVISRGVGMTNKEL